MGCRWADPATLLETRAEALLLFLLMTVEGRGMGEGARFTRAGLFQSEMVPWTEALGLSGTLAQGILCGRGGSVDALCVHSQCARLGI